MGTVSRDSCILLYGRRGEALEGSREVSFYPVRSHSEGLASSKAGKLSAPSMINEKHLASHFSNFWRASLPNLEAVLRAMNLGYDRYFRPLAPATDPRRRDLVSETGFRAFGLQLRDKGYRLEHIPEAFAQALQYLRQEVSHGIDVEAPSTLEAEEVKIISERITDFVRTFGRGARVRYMPRYAGHGLLSSCEGDLEIDNSLIEVKYVDRPFRTSDLRQILCYSALRYFRETSTYENVWIYNGLRGTAVKVGLDELVNGAGGRSKEEFFWELSYLLSSGDMSR